eukprot:1367727-Rhodomonas_salina.1
MECIRLRAEDNAGRWHRSVLVKPDAGYDPELAEKRKKVRARARQRTRQERFRWRNAWRERWGIGGWRRREGDGPESLHVREEREGEEKGREGEREGGGQRGMEGWREEERGASRDVCGRTGADPRREIPERGAEKRKVSLDIS